jgi:hypothetical protein
MSINSLDNFFDTRRLAKEFCPAPFALRRFRCSGNHQNGRSGEARAGPYHPAQLHAVDIRHLVVGNKTLNAFSPHEVHRSPRVPGDVHTMTAALERQREGPRIFRFIINQQDVRHDALPPRLTSFRRQRAAEAARLLFQFLCVDCISASRVPRDK